VIAVVSLAGCATRAPLVATAPVVEVPTSWAASASAAPGGAPANAQWWRGFGDEALSQAVEAALTANTDVAIAQANLRRARALRDVAVARGRPTLGASASVQRTTGSGSRNLFDAGFDAAWEPDLFGGTGHTVAAAEADARASALTLDALRVSLAAEVAADVVSLRSTRARLVIARANLAAQEETLQIARWREQAGLASSLEVAQARTSVEQTRAQLPVLQASAAQTRHALAVLMGRTPQSLEAAWPGDAPLPQLPAAIAADMPAQVLRQRPDVRTAEAQWLAAAERVAQADAARRPTLALRASAAWNGATLGSLGSAGALTTLLASLTQPLFDAGQRKAQLSAQEAAFDAARENYRASVLVALKDVEDAFSALDGARQRLTALRDAEASAADAALLASQRYASGIVDFQTVLDTQRNRLAAQDGAAVAQADWLTAHVRLFKALGGGWRDVAHSP